MLKKYRFLLLPLLVTALSGFFFFSSLDGKVYDLFLRAIPSLKEDKSVLILTIDDISIENVGIFPWTRDIYADGLVFLREMGTDTVAFDLSYLDDSPVIINPNYIKNELPRYIDNGFRRINLAVDQVMDGFVRRSPGTDELEEARTRLQRESRAARNELEVSMDYVTRDVDTYFAQALGFFGKSFLPFTMVSPRDILTEDKSFDMSRYNLPWLEENIGVRNLTVDAGSVVPDQAGMMPAIFKLLSRSRGAGFVNADVDRDGYLRRIFPVMKYREYYYPHLALAALRESLGNPAIEISRSHLVLKNASVKGSPPRDIRVPLAQDGSILLQWPRKNFRDYHTMSFWKLAQYNEIEKAFANNLSVMGASGFFTYWEEEDSPYDLYNTAEYVKSEIFTNGENLEEGITFDTYMEYRQAYLEAAGAFLNGSYEELILNDVKGRTDVEELAAEVFSRCRGQYGRMLELREEVSGIVKDSLCIVGMTATSGTDVGLITFQERFPNVGTYAVIANMILAGEFLADAPRWISWAIALVLSLIVAFMIKKLDTSKSIITGLVSMSVTGLFFLVVFITTRRYIGAVVPLAAVSFSFLSVTGLNFFTTIREKSFLRSAFSRYLAPSVIEQIIADPSKLNLGGEKREMTAIFTDVQSFSSFSEKFDPADLVKLLNLYLTDMSNIILKNQGTIDKYEGDAIIAFFGAPIHVGNHASLACRSAIQMKKTELTLISKIMDSQGPFARPLMELIEAGKLRRERPVYTRIGINTGDMVVGNMGTPNKMDYTIMGNAVNLAARLEGVNKQYSTSGILISEYTRAKIGDEFILRSLDRVRVVGINTPLRLYELLEIREEASQVLIDMTKTWEKAIETYEKRNFTDALSLFRAVSGRNASDQVAKLYMGRCEQYLKEAPPGNWDGVRNLTEK